MLILALDTSGDTCSLAIYNGAVCRTEYSFRHERHLSERLPGIVQFVLKDAGIALPDIEAFAVGLGPGSFTGVRIGVTMAKVWAKTLDKPVVGISSLDAQAEPSAVSGLARAAIAPTRRTESVAAYYAAGEASPVAPPAVVAHDVLIETARTALSLDMDTPLLLLGENVAIVSAATPEAQATNLLKAATPVTASAVARLAAVRLASGNVDDADTLVPLYVTPPPTG